MGEKAVELMYNRIRKPDEGFVHLALATNLIARDSVGENKKPIQRVKAESVFFIEHLNSDIFCKNVKTAANNLSACSS